MTAAVRKGYTTKGYAGNGLPAAPEKDLIEDPKIARRSTTFYAQLDQKDVMADLKAFDKAAKKAKKAARDAPGINQQMTADVRRDYSTKGYGEPEKDLIEDPKIARRGTTFYAQVDPVGAN